MTGILGRGSEGVMLLCLDAVSLAADSDAEAGSSDAAWSANAAALLRQARLRGWSVGHVISRRPRPGEAAWSPMAGLAPEPSEPVYHREQPSAFSNPELCAALVGGPRWDVVLCGVSVRGSGLTTALDALRMNLRLTIVGDAAWLPQAERDGLDGLLQLQRSGLIHSAVRLAPTAALLGPWRPLRLVQGGRV
jgi:hypothetical protein